MAGGDASVTPTLARVRTATNTVPAQAELWVDGRTTTTAPWRRIDRTLRALCWLALIRDVRT
jgi:hypothetical protein